MKKISYINFNGTTKKDRDLVDKLNTVASKEYPTSHRSPHNLARHILLTGLDLRIAKLKNDPNTNQSVA
jgi:hypothetical protein